MKRERNAKKPGAKKSSPKKADREAAVLAKIAQMPAPYRAAGERLHEIITKSVPGLTPRTWYGMPAYVKHGKVVCFFRVDDKYMTFGLTADANFTLEEGATHQLMECAWYFTALDDATEAKLSVIVRTAAN
jgi:hypothetical protein